jgi:hypothetical protein
MVDVVAGVVASLRVCVSAVRGDDPRLAGDSMCVPGSSFYSFLHCIHHIYRLLEVLVCIRKQSLIRVFPRPW